MWKPKEIIVNKSVIDDPATQYFLNQCPGVPIHQVDNGNPKTITTASGILSKTKTKILDKIIAGKQVVYISPATIAVDLFDMPDDRMLCPHFDRLKLASNGCFYQCDWCYLKLTYRAAFPYITVKVQYDKIKGQLEKRLANSTNPVIFNSGELADSLSMDHLTGAGKEFIPWFGKSDQGRLFMLTKSDNVDEILDLDHNGHTIIAWSMNNERISRKFEIGAPSFERRLIAAEKIQKVGYPLRIRLDPIIPFDGWEKEYAATIQQIFDKVSPERITIGTLRFEKGFYGMRETLFTTGPELPEILSRMEPMFGPKIFPGSKSPKEGKYSYSEEKRTEIFRYIINEIRKYSDCKIALCKESGDVWKNTGLDVSKCSCVCQLDYADMLKHKEKVEDKVNMNDKKEDIQLIRGHTNILLIAPHGVEDKIPYDDIATAELTRQIRKLLGCSAVINTAYRKPTGKQSQKRNNGKPSLKKKVLNLNIANQAEQVYDFINKIKEVIESEGLTYVFWIHGIRDDNIDDNVQCFIGCGQSDTRENDTPRYTAEKKTIVTVINQFEKNGIKAVLAPETSNYRGWKKTYMNQWFLLNGYDFKAVQSIQLEFKKTGSRDDDKSLKETAKNVAKAISSLLDSLPVKIAGSIVETAYSTLFEIFSGHYENAMIDAGKYVIKTFFGNDIEKARKKESTEEETLNQLYLKMDGENKGSYTPSKSKIYHAINLVIQEHDLKRILVSETFSTFRKLSLSHKIYLLSVKKHEQKEKLIKDIFMKQLTIKQLQNLKNKSSEKVPTPIFLINNPEELKKKENRNIVNLEALKKYPNKKLELLKEKVLKKYEDFEEKIDGLKNSIVSYQHHMEEYTKLKANIDKAVEQKNIPQKRINKE